MLIQICIGNSLWLIIKTSILQPIEKRNTSNLTKTLVTVSLIVYKSKHLVKIIKYELHELLIAFINCILYVSFKHITNVVVSIQILLVILNNSILFHVFNIHFISPNKNYINAKRFDSQSDYLLQWLKFFAYVAAHPRNTFRNTDCFCIFELCTLACSINRSFLIYFLIIWATDKDSRSDYRNVWR